MVAVEKLSRTYDDLDADDTDRLAQHLSNQADPGDVFLLDGPVGAGKTHFARAFILNCIDVEEDVPSPTFTLVQSYQGRDWPIWHCDLYRLSDVDELVELGLEEAMAEAVCLIEWPDRLPASMTSNATHLSFEITGNGRRRVTIQRSDPRQAEKFASP